jgi:hypothetical protein
MSACQFLEEKQERYFDQMTIGESHVNETVFTISDQFGLDDNLKKSSSDRFRVM